MNYTHHSWVKEFPAAITVCDSDGIILEMNDKSAKTFEKDGGYELIGKNLLDCHLDPARGKLERLMDARRRNVYTIEKNGIKKLIYQTPWYENGQYAGFVEMAFEIPFDIPHFIRDE
jgi:transcriptional regulator with PAS, ATPase and Fis domain